MVELNGSSNRSRFSLPVLKLSPRSGVELTIQSMEPVCVTTHWIGRRLWCAGEDCPGCQVSPCRSVAYLIATYEHLGSERVVLVETTPQELSRVAGFVAMGEYKPGSGLKVYASKAKKQSPTRLEVVGDGGKIVSDFADTRRAVAAASVLAGVPLPAADSSLEAYFERIKPAVRQILEAAIARQTS